MSVLSLWGHLWSPIWVLCTIELVKVWKWFYSTSQSRLTMKFFPCTWIYVFWLFSYTSAHVQFKDLVRCSHFAWVSCTTLKCSWNKAPKNKAVNCWCCHNNTWGQKTKIIFRKNALAWCINFQSPWQILAPFLSRDIFFHHDKTKTYIHCMVGGGGGEMSSHGLWSVGTAWDPWGYFRQGSESNEAGFLYYLQSEHK